MITVPQLLAPVDPEAPLLVVATREEAEHLGVDVPVLMPLPWGADRRASADAAIRAGVGRA